MDKLKKPSHSLRRYLAPIAMMMATLFYAAPTSKVADQQNTSALQLKEALLTTDNTVEEIVIAKAKKEKLDSQKIEKYQSAIDATYKKYSERVKTDSNMDESLFKSLIEEAKGLDEVSSDRYKTGQDSIFTMADDGEYNCASFSAFLLTVVEKLINDLPLAEQSKSSVSFLYAYDPKLKQGHRYVHVQTPAGDFSLDMNGVKQFDMNAPRAELPLKAYKQALMGEKVILETNLPFNDDFPKASETAEKPRNDEHSHILFKGGLPQMESSDDSKNEKQIRNMDELKKYLATFEGKQGDLDLQYLENVTIEMAQAIGERYSSVTLDHNTDTMIFRLLLGDLKGWNAASFHALFEQIQKRRDFQLVLDLADDKLPDFAFNELQTYHQKHQRIGHFEVHCKWKKLPIAHFKLLMGIGSLDINYTDLSDEEIAVVNDTKNQIQITGSHLSAHTINKILPSTDNPLWPVKLYIPLGAYLQALSQNELAKILAQKPEIAPFSYGFGEPIHIMIAYKLSKFNSQHRIVKDLQEYTDEHGRYSGVADSYAQRMEVVENNLDEAAKNLGITKDELKAQIGIK